MAEETGWLFGHGSLFQDQKLKDKRLPDRHDLDKVSTDIPVAMMAGGHNLILNSKALELVGIGPGFRVPAGATVELDDSGHPNGIIKDLEHLLPIPRPDLSTKEKALKAISREHLTANGVTTIGDISHSSEGIELADRLIGSGDINVRFRTYIWAPRSCRSRMLAGGRSTSPSTPTTSTCAFKGSRCSPTGGTPRRWRR